MYHQNFSKTIARRIAESGAVLLENDRILPLKNQTNLVLFGRGTFETRKGGAGSADVLSPYNINICDGLKNCNLPLDERFRIISRDETLPLPTSEELAAAAMPGSAALLTLTRDSSEGSDHAPEPGDLLLSERESRLIQLLDDAPFEKLIFLINAYPGFDLSWIRTIKKPKALLLLYFPGQEGGDAAAALLTGAVTPSGKLTSTQPRRWEDLPSSPWFRESLLTTEYVEDIFVGYRYFETFAPEQVLYPFGHGLSYTSFVIEPEPLAFDAETVTVRAHVRNTGDRPGREVVQLYVSKPAAAHLPQPARELAAYAKTPLLQPGESCSVELHVPPERLESFDDNPHSADYGCRVRPGGMYRFFCGNSVRAAQFCGELQFSHRILATPGILLQGGLSRRMTGTGEIERSMLPQPEPQFPRLPEQPTGTLTLEAVASGQTTLTEFVAQLSVDELIHLVHAQGSLIARGTAGIGNLPARGIPTLQTADGPAGIRRTIPTTCFPCPVLAASTWDSAELTELGRAIAADACEYNIDVLLAPGLNIQRNPLCGRNFEYYSEDPLLAGNTAAAEIRGIQSGGVAATVKHFAANNREALRSFNNSVVSERALREIYLKGFEIAVKTGKPACLMASYNLVNNERTGGSCQLLRSILRKEWGFDGVVMSDWRTPSVMWQDLLASNDLRMPLVPNDPQYRQLAEMVRWNVVPRRVLEESAGRVLQLILGSRRFACRDFGTIHHLAGPGPFRLGGLEMNTVSATFTQEMACEDQGSSVCHGRLCRDFGGNDVILTYLIDLEESDTFEISVRLATPAKHAELKFRCNGHVAGTLALRATGPASGEYDFRCWETQGALPLTLQAGRNQLELRITDPDDFGISLNHLTLKRISGSSGFCVKTTTA